MDPFRLIFCVVFVFFSGWLKGPVKRKTHFIPSFFKICLDVSNLVLKNSLILKLSPYNMNKTYAKWINNWLTVRSQNAVLNVV